MSINKLIRHFEALGRIPVSMTEVIDEFRRSILDAGLRVKGVDLPANVLRGTHYRYHHGPSSDESAILPGPIAMVIYSVQQPLGWQRLVCCKELIHVLDSPAVRTNKKSEVIQLGDKLTDKTRHFKGTADLQWFFDDLAIYQALAMLFPFSLREEIMGAYVAGKVTDEMLAEAAQIPVEYVRTVMSDGWKLLRESILLSD
ncbi:hypothetical protein [Rhizobium lusitanum]|nr:hypothetical protein [Rhizobium lusitanum]